MELQLPARSKTDLDDDRAQSVLRAISSNFFKTKLDAKNRQEFLNRQLINLKSKKKKAHTRITRTIKETMEQAENLKKDKARAVESRTRREQSLLMRKESTMELSSVPPLSRALTEDDWIPGRSSKSMPSKNADPCQSLDSCRFVEHKKQCSTFPCIPCASYNTIGFFIDENRREMRSTRRPLSPASREAFWEEIERTSVVRPLRQPYNRAVKQERSLNKMMLHMRQKNEKIKPKDFSVKYGEPTPLRKILNPVRA